MADDFLETPRFPACPNYGLVSESGYNVTIIRTASGLERRNRNWEYPLHDFRVVVGPRAEEEIAELHEFYQAVGGEAFGFRLKDPNDYKSCRKHLTATALDGVLILDEGNSPESYQLTKQYVAGALTQYRKAHKPVAGTILIADNGVTKTETTDYVIDYTTGLVVLNFSPVGPLTWGGEFDVPVRFVGGFPVEIFSNKVDSVQILLTELRL